MAKVRVYELAKELGLESKVVMTKLNELGEFVRSASSTVEPPVVRKLREALPAAPAADAPAKPAKKAAAKKAARCPGRGERPTGQRAGGIPRARSAGPGASGPRTARRAGSRRVLRALTAACCCGGACRPGTCRAGSRDRRAHPSVRSSSGGSAPGQQPLHLWWLERHGPSCSPAPGQQPLLDRR